MYSSVHNYNNQAELQETLKHGYSQILLHRVAVFDGSRVFQHPDSEPRRFLRRVSDA